MTARRVTLRRCGDVTEGELNRRRLNLLRPGAKVVLYDTRGRVLLGRLPDGYPNRFNFSGGGVDDGETLAPALAREFSEEMKGPELSVAALADAPIIAEGRLPFLREGFRGKYEYLIGYQVSDIRAYQPRADSKLVCFPPLAWSNAQMIIRCATYVKRDMRLLYGRAVRNVGHLLHA